MLGKHDKQGALYQYFNLEDLVPENHLLRRINAVLDLGFLRELVAPLYAENVGRPSIDPEVAFRMMLLGYLYNLSDNRLAQEIVMHGGYRWFCGLDFNDDVPERSSLLKIRERWAKAGVLDEILQRVVAQCISSGLVKGDTLLIDGTLIKANAAINSLEEIGRILELESSENEADDDPPDDGAKPRPPRKAGDPDFHGEKFTNATHRSATDPDARLYRKGPGKETKLSYIGNNLVDGQSRVILSTKAMVATGTAEREAALEMLESTDGYLRRDQRPLVAMDAGYKAGDFLSKVIETGFDPVVPLPSEKFEELPTWKRATRNPDYRRKRKEKRRAAEARNYVRSMSKTKEGRYARKQRQLIEHTFAEAKQWCGLERARGRGLERLQTQLVLTAITQNLKRLSKHLVLKKVGPAAQSVNQIFSVIKEHAYCLGKLSTFYLSTTRLGFSHRF